MKILWLTLGLLCLGLGLIGIVLPFLPTVPFLIAATACFARSSERLHHWLISHPTFGPLITDWHGRGAISLRAKRAATVSILAVLAISLALNVKWPALLAQAIILSFTLIFIWTRPN